MEIKLQKQNIKNLDIDGKHYICDCNNLESMEAINQFAEKYKEGQISFGKELLDDCKKVIDVVLEKEAWNDLFGDTESSLAPYYLCLELNHIYTDEFMKDEKERQKAEQEKAMAEAKDIIGNMKEFANTVDYAKGKYGGNNVMAHKKRSSKNYRNR